MVVRRSSINTHPVDTAIFAANTKNMRMERSGKGGVCTCGKKERRAQAVVRRA